MGIGDNDADNLRKAERCNREVVAAQTQAGQTDEKRQCCRQQAADDERNAERKGQRVERRDERLKHEDGFLFGDGDGQQCDGIRADCHEARMTEGKDACKAVDQIHGQGEDDVDGAQPCDADDIFAGIAFDIEQYAAEQSQQQAGQDDRAFLYFCHSLHLLRRFFAQQTGRLDEQHQNQHHECERIAIAGERRKERDRDNLNKADEQTAQHSTCRIADSAQNRRDEALDARHGADGRTDSRVFHAPHDGADAGESRTDEEGDGDGAVQVDTHQTGGVVITGDGAHRQACFGVLDENQ